MSKNKDKLSLKPKIKYVVKAGTKTCGRKKVSGASLVITLVYLYGPCESYSNIESKMTAVEFFKSSRSSHFFLGPKSRNNHLGGRFKTLIMGNLKTQMERELKIESFLTLKTKLLATSN